jgi:RNA polymerase sigma factor (sigma-70 family)
MAKIPTTSTTLLCDLANDSQHVRWGEFVARYRSMMEAYMRERFPSLDADDVIQETLIAVCAALPSYRYAPEEKGYFHNYLTGILRNKALRQLHRDQRQAEITEMVGQDASIEPLVGSRVPRDRDGRAVAPRPPSGMMADDEQSWRETLVEIALQQLMNDESIQSRTRQVFLRVAVNGEKPDDVAAAFGIERNAVDQIKNRMTARLRELVAALEKVDGA